MTAQLIVMVSLAIDSCWPQLKASSNPVDAQLVSDPGKRKDPELQTALLDKFGHKAPANVEMVGSYHGLQGHWVGAALRRRLCCYFFALRHFFPECKVLTVVLDASR